MIKDFDLYLWFQFDLISLFYDFFSKNTTLEKSFHQYKVFFGLDICTVPKDKDKFAIDNLGISLL